MKARTIRELFFFSRSLQRFLKYQLVSGHCRWFAKAKKKLVVAAQLSPVPESNLTSAKTEEFLATHGISLQAHVYCGESSPLALPLTRNGQKLVAPSGE